MEIVLLVARLVLAAVFGLAGISKFADPSGTRKAVLGFGVPEWLAVPLSWLLPVVEILIAVALISTNAAWWGATAAMFLLLVFSAGIGVNLARGKSPDCHCFGQLHSRPVSWSLFARNLALAVTAGFIVTKGKEQPALSAVRWLADLNTGQIVNLVLSAAAASIMVFAIVYLRKVLDQQRTLLEKIDSIQKVVDEDYAEPAPVEREDALPPSEGLPVGAPAPDFALTSIDGESISLGDLLEHSKPVLLLFVSPSCAPCKSLLPLVRVWQRDYGDRLTVALASKGTAKENRNKMTRYGSQYLLLQGESRVAEEYQTSWTPASVLISQDGKIASRVHSGDDAIRALVNHSVTTGSGLAMDTGHNGDIPHITLGNSLFELGDPAPRFSLPSSQGKDVGLENLLGTPTLLIFWDSHCPHCQAMAADLRDWEAKPPKGAPKLAFVVSGNAEKVREDFRSLILLDPDFDVAPLYGSQSTPSAVLIDGDGKVASSLAKGARNVLALVGVRKKELPIAPSLRSTAQQI